MSNNRRLGGNYSLSLDTGNNTHLTMVYFYNLGRGYPQQKVNELAKEFMIEHGYDQHPIELIIGDLWGRRSYLIHGQIKEIQKQLVDWFANMPEYNVDTTDRAYTPHIDPRGQPINLVKTQIDLINDWRFDY